MRHVWGVVVIGKTLNCNMPITNPSDWEFLYLEKFTISNYDSKKIRVNGYQFFEYIVNQPLIRIGVNVEKQSPRWNLGCWAYQLIAGGLLLKNYKYGNQTNLKRLFCRAGMATDCLFYNLGKPYTLMLQLPLWLLDVKIEIHEYVGDLPTAYGAGSIQPGQGIVPIQQSTAGGQGNATQFGQIIPGVM